MISKSLIVPAIALTALAAGVGGGVVIKDALIKKRAEPYIALINKEEQLKGLPPGFLFSILLQESHFDPDIISGKRKSPVGAVGIAQFMPSTAAWLLGVPQDKAVQMVLDTNIAIPLAAKYLAMLRKGKGITNWEQTAAAYNWGGGAVAKAIGKYGAIGYRDHLPAETKNYIAKIKDTTGVSLV